VFFNFSSIGIFAFLNICTVIYFLFDRTRSALNAERKPYHPYRKKHGKVKGKKYDIKPATLFVRAGKRKKHASRNKGRKRGIIGKRSRKIEPEKR
jgi:hypothetical protein